MTANIKFGTSGWRAIIAEDFTVANVRRAITGIARHVTSKNPAARVVVGRDPRFMGERFVEIAADVLSAFGVRPLVITEPAPTPAISYELVRLEADGAINFTASHNPPEYNGIKFSTPDGAPALPEVTSAIEGLVPNNGDFPGSNGGVRPTVEKIDPKPAYVARLREIIDLPLIRKSGLKIVYDPLWGAARNYPDDLLRDAGIPVSTVHDMRDVLFGGHAPEPDGGVLEEMRATMQATGARIGIATDGDADRFGIVDEDGTFIQPNYVLALLFDYLVETRGWKNGVGKSVATTNMINALAEYYKVELHETPVGFKYIGELIKQDKLAIGGEESAGLTIRHHVPEKDGILAGLLCCEAVARRKKSLRRQIEENIFGKVGSFYPQRDNFLLTPEVKQKFTEKLTSDPVELAGRKVRQVVRTDGMKLIFNDGSWICYRLSGTEPVVRVYSEAKSEAELRNLALAARDWIFN
ncbi:MAG TPA: phosphoglucomutase/phosphomannomutase family protein [Candidatus Limnocylindrales bacterium]|nr:phosphoglucomutase/phosphomannomutase family protein [Candidatus Limnocylindrales bacterium]